MIRRTDHESSAAGVNDQSLRNAVVELIEYIGICDGEVIITIHEGDATKVDINLAVRVVFSKQLESNKTANAVLTADRKAQVIRLKAIEPMVRWRLQSAICKTVGAFGGMRIMVENANLKEWGFFDRRR